MAEHSKEPWRAIPGAVVCEHDGAANRIPGAYADGYYDGGHLVAESVCEPDARRICATVNACVGIPTDELEMLARAGKALTAHGAPRPTAAESDLFKFFLFGHWTVRPPTAPGLYLVVDLSGGRAAIELTEERTAARIQATVRWWWSRPLTLACLTAPSLDAVPREGDGSAREPGMW